VSERRVFGLGRGKKEEKWAKEADVSTGLEVLEQQPVEAGFSLGVVP
jgi:hypothetical protein